MSRHQSHLRLVRKLEEGLGNDLCAALADPDVVEIMVNPDGRTFIERFSSGTVAAGTMTSLSTELIIGVVAHVLQTEANRSHPVVSGELPIGGHRFEGVLPPVVSGPAFSIRRRASRIIALQEYVDTQAMTTDQAATIRKAVASRQNVLIAGGTGSGKTTLANALIAEMAAMAPSDRIVVLEDTAEINCPAINTLSLRTAYDVDMNSLLKSTMRLRPDRIVVGELRDGAALTLLKAWNTGHPGGVTTLHANSAVSALRRLEQLTAEISQQPMREVIGDAVDIVISMQRTQRGRKVTDIIAVSGYDGSNYQLRGI
ncbi:P-type conjugative transfer ATPase TrbB [Aminobacter aganoensis]|uniref:Type IV secretion system protein VirB11 n=1 Tax=Aminobacter aganoensis TaxID=83264 RepID=A0A7X0FCG2_9HYPH|nr:MULTISPECIES: P-type conjugative transfer ATPase TrbB [Aminobacter]KQU74487.1 conjugal transfer protein TrbB [Aminobacter sp. DSM 101952]MBB6357097.1 type IV secretion system protein VirB11 [Aminobacter aganoensis]